MQHTFKFTHNHHHNVRNTTTVCTKDGFFPPFITSEILMVKSVLDRLIVLFWSYWFLTGQRSFATVHFWCFDFRSSEVTLILALKKVTSDCLIQFWSRSWTLLQGTYITTPCYNYTSYKKCTSQWQSHGCVLRIRLLLEHVFSSVRMNSRYQALFLSTHQEPRYEASCKCKTNCLREC